MKQRTVGLSGKIRTIKVLCAAAALIMLIMAVNIPSVAQASAYVSRLAQFTGFGGAEYYKKSGYYVNIYGPGGVITEVRYKAGGSRQKLYYLADLRTGEEQTAYCLASGLSFSSGAEYEADLNNGESFSSYYDNLPESARKGIAYASIYGFNEKTMRLGGPGPVEGTYGADFWMATQCIIWEYQQGIRTDAGMRISSGQVEADNYYSIIKGKPAEKCYDYLLNVIKNATAVPSFAKDNESGWSTVLTLKETSNGSGVYKTSVYSRITLPPGNYYVTDENGARLPDVSFSFSGNTFSLTSAARYNDGKRVMIRKEEEQNGEGAAVFFAPDDSSKQTMLSTGGRLRDPYALYLSIKTQDDEGEKVDLRINKTSADGRREGIPFVFSWESSDGLTNNRTVYTDASGIAETQFIIGAGAGNIRSDLRYVGVLEQAYDTYNASLTAYSGGVSAVTEVFFYRTYQSGSLIWKFDASKAAAEAASFDGKSYSGHMIALGNVGGNSGGNTGGESTAVLDYYNEPRKGAVKVVKTSDTGDGEGFVFELKGSDPENEHIAVRKTTDSSGSAVWEDVLPGEYTLREILPADSIWEQPDPLTVTVKPEKTVNVSVHNTRKKGAIKIIKTSDDDRFDGIKFIIEGYGGRKYTIEPDEDSIQIIDGKQTFVAMLSGLAPGNYIITEAVPARYKGQPPAGVTVEPGRTTEVRFHNEMNHVSFTVTKSIYAEEFIPAHGDATFIFKIKDIARNNTYYKLLSFSEEDKHPGQTGLISKSFSISGLEPGMYEVTELKTLRYEPETITVSPGNIVTGETAYVILRNTLNPAPVWVEFVNRVVNQEKTTDTAFCVNVF